MVPLISEHRDDIAALCRRYHVCRLEVIGSAARGDDFDRELSDADFLVEFRELARFGPLEQFFGFSDELSTLLNRPVDIIEFTAIRNPFLLAEINSSRELVYAA